MSAGLCVVIIYLLLIVPEWIEMLERPTNARLECPLLIEPEGIEIC